MTKKELCKKLAEDYADRVARVKEKELQQQYKQQGLGKLDGFIVG